MSEPVAIIETIAAFHVEAMIAIARHAYANDVHAGCAVKREFPDLSWEEVMRVCMIASGDADDAPQFWQEVIELGVRMDEGTA